MKSNPDQANVCLVFLPPPGQLLRNRRFLITQLNANLRAKTSPGVKWQALVRTLH